jgi:hypothetical protein
MVKAAEAIETIEAATGIPRVTIERAAYILRRADGDLFPTGGRGGGTAAPRPTVPHLVNLALAIYAADPLIEAPDLVRRYRDLVPGPPNRLWMLATFGSDPEAWAQSEQKLSAVLDYLCPGPTLGDMLDGLVRHLMTTDDRDIARQCLTSVSVWHRRFRGGAIGAHIYTRFGSRSFQEPVGGLLPLMEEGLEDRNSPVAAAFDTVTIPFAIFEILADLVRDDVRGHGHKPSSDAAGGTAAEDIKKATPATGGTGPASADAMAGQPGGNPVNLAADGSSQQDSGEKERRQRPPPSAPRGSSSSDVMDQSKDEPPWPRSSLPMLSAG